MKFASHRRGRTAVPASTATRQATYLLNRGRSGALVLGLAAAMAIPASASASASNGPSPVVGHVYVNDNTKPGNTIGAFDRHADGTLTREAGSPFAAGGAGTGSGLASQGALQFSADGRFLIAVDAGSDQISVLRVRSDGSLRLVPGGVVSSRGGLPDSLAVHGDLLYVANSGAGHSNYTGFRLGFGGHLFHLPGSTVPLASGAAPGDVLFNGTGTKLVGTEVGPSVIDSFTVGSGGRLTAAPGSPFPAQGLGPFGSEFRPTNPDQLFVSNAHNTATDSGTVSAFKDHRNGRLSSIEGSPFPDHQMAPCWVEITHNGQFLFTVNTASGTISGYQIAANGALTLLPGSTSAGGPSAGAVDARLSPDGGFLYVDQAKANAVAAFAVNGASLTQLGASPFPLPAGAAPAGIVIS